MTTNPLDQPNADEPATSAVVQRENPWLRVLALFGPIVALMAALLVTVGLMRLLPASIDDASDGVRTLLVVVQSLVVCLLAILFCALLLRLHGLRLADVGLRWTSASGAGLLAGLAVGAVVVLMVGLPLSGLGLLRFEGGGGMPWWSLLIIGVAQGFLLQGFPEELLFRGYQMSTLRLRPVAAVLVSSVVFAALHLLSGGGQQSTIERIFYLMMPFGFALAAAALMIVTESLWAAVGVHTGVHVGSMLGGFMGVGNGPHLWLACGLVWTMIGVAILVIAQRQGRFEQVWAGPER